MTDNPMRLRAKVKEYYEKMQALRDDVRERLQVGGMEEWAEWQKLEHEVVACELGVVDMSEELLATIRRLVAGLSKLRSALLDAATAPSSSRVLVLDAGESFRYELAPAE